MTNRTHAPGFFGELSFSKVNEYMDTLLVLGAEEGIPFAQVSFPNGEGTGASFKRIALALRCAEDARVDSGAGSDGLLPLVAMGTDASTKHPLNWLNVSERKKSDETRSCHQLYATIEDDGRLWLTFEHGKFGYRREPHPSWSSAFYRMAELMSARRSWHQFGDLESQSTMLGKGQFYWQDPATRKLVPVDNFVFRVADAFSIRVSGVSHRCVLNVERAGCESAHEWYNDYAQALMRAADVLAGAVDLEKFGVNSNPDQHDAAPGVREPASNTGLVADGQFFVESIYEARDVLPAPVLVYQTAEGQQARLAVAEGTWLVGFGAGEGKVKTRAFLQQDARDALRALAHVLQGKTPLVEF